MTLVLLAVSTGAVVITGVVVVVGDADSPVGAALNAESAAAFWPENGAAVELSEGPLADESLEAVYPAE